MGTALKVRPSSLPLPAMPVPVDPLALLPDHARIEAERCLAIIRPALIRVQQGVSVRAAAMWLATSAEGMPSEPTIRRWLRDYLTGGIVDLAPKYKGRKRKVRGWEARAAALYNQPQKPAYATVAWWLRKEGYQDATNHSVRRYLQALPSNAAETGRKRLGAHHYDQNIRPHKVRDASVLPVGFVYEGDGHTCDVYVAHPSTGKPFRPELTTWIDIRSQKIVSWWISEAESAHTTLFSLSQAFVAFDHVPAFVHTDPGSGFKARLISDEVVGFLKRFNIDPIVAIAGNARGKGLKEGWFKWFEERCGKTFDTYCGHDRTDDYLRHLSEKVKRGQIVLPTLQQFIDKVREYVACYNAEPHEGTDGKTPDQLWQQLDHVRLHTPAEAIIRPRKQRTVQRWGVRIDGRRYRAGALAQFEGRDVIVEYSIHTDDRVWVHDLKGVFICEARLVEKTPWLPASRIEQAQQKRLEGQRQRHLRAIAEQEARARTPIPVSFHQAEVLPFDAGHSIAPPVAPRAIAPAEPQLDARTSEILDALDVKPAPVRGPQRHRPLSTEEEIEQRFALALDLQARLDAGEAIAADDAAWLQRYQTTAEFRGQMRLLDITQEKGPRERASIHN